MSLFGRTENEHKLEVKTHFCLDSLTAIECSTVSSSFIIKTWDVILAIPTLKNVSALIHKISIQILKLTSWSFTPENICQMRKDVTDVITIDMFNFSMSLTICIFNLIFKIYIFKYNSGGEKWKCIITHMVLYVVLNHLCYKDEQNYLLSNLFVGMRVIQKLKGSLNLLHCL